MQKKLQPTRDGKLPALSMLEERKMCLSRTISKSPLDLCNGVPVAAAKDRREDWKEGKEAFPSNNSSSSETLFWLSSLAWARDSRSPPH